MSEIMQQFEEAKAQWPTPKIPYLWQFEGREPGPTLTILGGVHGNETFGIKVVQELIEYTLVNGVRLGMVNLGIGNPEAAKANKRYLQMDLNRCFGDQNGELPEQKRATELESILAETDILIDLHATINPSEPMIIAQNPDHPLAKKVIPVLGIAKVMSGKGLLPNGRPVYTDAYVASHEGAGIAIEGGWLEDPQIHELAANVRAAITALGHMKFDDEVDPIELEQYDAYSSLAPETEDFYFTKQWGNFEEVKAGTTIAYDNGVPIVLQVDSLTLFAKSPDKIVVGQEAVLLLRKKS